MLTCLLKEVPSGELLTVDMVKLQCRIDTADEEDDLLMQLIGAARQQAEVMTRRVLRESVWSYTTDEIACLETIRLVPCTALHSVTVAGEVLESDAVSFSPSGTQPGEQVFASCSGLEDGVAATLELTCGYTAETLPLPIAQWMLLQIGAWYEQRESIGIGVQLAKAPHSFADALLEPYIIAWSC